MKVSDIAKIGDPVSRFMKATQALRTIEKQKKILGHIRNEALLELREPGEHMIQSVTLARMIGVSRQRLHTLEKNAREKIESIRPPWDREDWEDGFNQESTGT